MLRHDVGDIFKDFEVVKQQCRGFIVAFFRRSFCGVFRVRLFLVTDCLFKHQKVSENVPPEPDTILPRDGSTCPKRHFSAVNFNGLTDSHDIPPFYSPLDTGTELVRSGIYGFLYQSA